VKIDALIQVGVRRTRRARSRECRLAHPAFASLYQPPINALVADAGHLADCPISSPRSGGI